MLKDGEKGSISQRDKVTYAIAPHLPCGVVTPQTLRKLADVAEKYGCAAVKLTSAARFALVGLKEEDLDAAWQELGVPAGAAVGLCVRSVKACPGTTFCKLGQQDSLTLGMTLDEKYHGMELPSKFKIGVSGCMNQCAETCIKDLGLVGKKKGWTVLVGGSGGAKPHLAEELADELTTEQALDVIDKVIDFYRQNAPKRERLWKTIERVGLETLRQAVLPRG
ncbi:MAG: NAD(P)/FAD-dependent oxidoreductase [Phycisphaerae bacterium]|nr:NAD(P)/FAD-dependent oxidoreductase [Phycisphaerae bacterium]